MNALTIFLHKIYGDQPRRVVASSSHLLRSNPLKAQRLAVIGLALGLLLVSGCRTDVKPIQEWQGDVDKRIEVVAHSYVVTRNNDHRSVIVLRDNETNQEFLAVQGFGVTQIVFKSAGKTTYRVEE